MLALFSLLCFAYWLAVLALIELGGGRRYTLESYLRLTDSLLQLLLLT